MSTHTRLAFSIDELNMNQTLLQITHPQLIQVFLESSHVLAPSPFMHEIWNKKKTSRSLMFDPSEVEPLVSSLAMSSLMSTSCSGGISVVPCPSLIPGTPTGLLNKGGSKEGSPLPLKQE